MEIDRKTFPRNSPRPRELGATEKLTGEPTTDTVHDESVDALRKQILEAAAGGVKPVAPDPAAPAADVEPPVPDRDAEPPAAEPGKPSG